MFDFHKDKVRYFEMQRKIAADYVYPFIKNSFDKSTPWRVLEIGCAEAGVLKAFLDAGHHGVGIELQPSRAALARDFLKKEIEEKRCQIDESNIYDVEPSYFGGNGFDVIILKDVIEHIPEQEKIIPRITEFLAPGGVIFFGFPPWYMPFGGHQQIASKSIVNKIPWLHLLPKSVYEGYIKAAGEPLHVQEELKDVRSTRISTARFERIIKKEKLQIAAKTTWLFNPIYSMKFGIPAREQFSFISGIPIVRDFCSTAVFYLISNKK